MANVLFISASPRGAGSAAVQAAEVFLGALSEEHVVTRLDLFNADLPEYTEPMTRAKQKTMTGMDMDAEEATQWQAVTQLVEQFIAADHVLFALPMWNFSIPYKFKQYIDLITHPGLTFTMDKDGPRGVGSATGTVIYSRGGDYSPKDGQPDPFDFQSPYINAWASLVGISPLEEVLVQRTMAGPDAQTAAVDAATPQLQALAAALS